jgi:hypothetical protein
LNNESCMEQTGQESLICIYSILYRWARHGR